ncbi:DNA internalization-related competence protein ComEC/Rec2 [uncultured Vibrio sp.]|uniref:DNA internalization-related competence protein ComEC/Rec2 n=1 Tax=uncultured Vibrio sp. TaxID=114054 RepID=UPI0025CBF521|nr:DNA internalization-related competence protein ComEC/Rec2 [uncultured Vibrio sp.]
MIFESGADITISAQIDSFFKQIRHGYEGTVLLRSINGQTLPYFYQPKIRLVSAIPLNIGDVVEAKAIVKPVYGWKNELGFDLESYYLSQNWLARATIQSQQSFVVKSRTSYRQILYQRIHDQISRSPVKGPILALVFGERSHIAPQQWDAYRNSGLIHLIAISGLHIGVIYMVGFLCGKLVSRLSNHFLWAPWVLGCALAVLYSWLAGFSLPTTRALAMCLVGSLLVMARIQQPVSMKLLMTLSIVLVISPFSAVSNSFWLSFYAVSIVLYVLSQSNSGKSTWRLVLKVQLLLVLFMAPLTAFLFGGVSVSSLIYNVLFVAWFTFVVIPFVFVSLFLTLFNPSFLSEIWLAVEYLLLPMEWATKYAVNTWLVLSRTHVYFAASLCLAVLLCSYLNRQARVLILVVLLSVWVDRWLKQEESIAWKVDVLDVGHGLSVLIEKDNKVIIYDTGNSWESGSVADSLIIPILSSRGISTIDTLILSHLDADHAGGRDTIAQRLTPTRKLSPQTIEDYELCIKGKEWDWQGLRLSVLWPQKGVNRAYNPHSCVIRIEDKLRSFSLLLTGDIDALVEWMLIRDPSTLASDVLIVPHHGSMTSSTPKFLEAVEPSVAIASLAKGGRWNLPADKVLDRYRDRNIEWLDTAQSGQVTVHVKRDMWQVSTIRQTEGVRWYRQMLRNGVE